MTNRIDIYKNGDLKEECEAESFIIFIMEDDHVRCIENLDPNAAELAGLCSALGKVKAEIESDITQFMLHMLIDLLDDTEDEESSETEEHLKSDALATKPERVEMTPEVIEAITKQAKKQADKAESSKTANHKTLAKKLSVLAKTLTDRI